MLLVALALGAPSGPTPKSPVEKTSPIPATAPRNAGKKDSPPHAPAAKSDSQKTSRPAGHQAQGFASRLWGAQLLLFVDQEHLRLGGAATQKGIGLGLGKWISFRYQDTLSIGGLAGKLSYRAQLQLAFGLFYRAYQDHGLLLRGGIAADWHAAQGAKGRWLRVPEVQVGWGGIAGALQYEALATASPYVYHRWRPLADLPAHTAHSASVGAIASLIFRRLRFSWRADWTWLERRARLKQQGDLCLHFLSRAPNPGVLHPKLVARKEWFGPHEQRYRAGICASAQRTAQWTAPQMAPRTHFGLLLSLGKTYFLDPIR